MKIALILNTRSNNSEFEIEYDPPHTIELIKNGIEQTGNEYIFIEANEDFVENLKLTEPDLVFNRAEGIRGESRESHVPAMLEMLNIPYVGSNVLTNAIALNKSWAKKIISYHSIPTPRFETISQTEDLNTIEMNYPIILKPNNEGSSMGINEDNVVYDFKNLKQKFQMMISLYNQPVLLEEFIQGRELSVGLLGNGNQKPEILSILEIDFSLLPDDVANVFGQRAKTKYDSLDHYICPANISISLKKELEILSLNVWKSLDIKDFARIDYRMNKNGKLFFLEVNPLPGMDFDLDDNDFSFYPLMAFKSDYTYNELIYRILNSACLRYGLSLKR